MANEKINMGKLTFFVDPKDKIDFSNTDFQGVRISSCRIIKNIKDSEISISININKNNKMHSDKEIESEIDAFKKTGGKGCIEIASGFILFRGMKSYKRIIKTKRDSSEFMQIAIISFYKDEMYTFSCLYPVKIKKYADNVWEKFILKLKKE